MDSPYVQFRCIAPLWRSWTEQVSVWSRIVSRMAYSNCTAFIQFHTTFQLKQAGGRKVRSREQASEINPCGNCLETCPLTGKQLLWRGLGTGSRSISGRSGLKLHLRSASGVLFATDVAAMGLNVPHLCIGVSLGICQNYCFLSEHSSVLFFPLTRFLLSQACLRLDGSGFSSPVGLRGDLMSRASLSMSSRRSRG